MIPEFGKRESWHYIHHPYELGDIVEIGIYDLETRGVFSGKPEKILPLGKQGVVIDFTEYSITIMFDGWDKPFEVMADDELIELIPIIRSKPVNNPDLYDHPLFDLDSL